MTTTNTMTTTTTMTATTGATLAEELHDAAHALFLSNDTVDWTIANSSPDQVGACIAMLRHELDRRADNKAAKMLRDAHFPVPKSLDAFDWSVVEFPDKWSLEEMLTLRFVDDTQDLVLFGDSGLGKTHVATGLGMLAVSRGIPVRFYDTSTLVMRLSKANKEDKLDKVLNEVAKARMVILDEFGYIPYSIDAARLLYRVLSSCYEQRSVVITTNIEFSLWDTVMSDSHLAKASADRMYHHGRLLQFRGESYRLKNSLMLGRGT